jgi:hypothetical protein
MATAIPHAGAVCPPARCAVLVLVFPPPSTTTLSRVRAQVTVTSVASANAGESVFAITFTAVGGKLTSALGVDTTGCAAFTPSTASVSVRRSVVGDPAAPAVTASLTTTTARKYRADNGVVPLAAPPSIPRSISLTIVTNHAVGLSFTTPALVGSASGVDKFRIEWDTSRLFTRDNDPAWSHVFSAASCTADSPNCRWNSGTGAYQYEIGDGEWVQVEPLRARAHVHARTHPVDPACACVIGVWIPWTPSPVPSQASAATP